MNTKENQLEERIKEQAQKYYGEGNPDISDAEFDKLVEELRMINPDNEILHTTGWGFDVDKVKLEKSDHEGTIAGMSKVKSPESLENYFKDKYSNHRVNKLVATPKLDGISVVLYYRKGVLVKALTRGNGNQGVDITFKMKKIVPESISLDEHNIILRGELVLDLDTFNEKYEDSPSPRNVASGIAMRKSLKGIEDLTFVAYKIHRTDEPIEFSTLHNINLTVLSKVGFEVAHFLNINISQIDLDENYIDNLFETFDDYPYPIDGVVFTLNYLDIDDEGFLSYEEVAYKIITDKEMTIVEDVEWNLTPKSRMVPVVRVAPVNVSGAKISKITAYNKEFIKENNINRGAVVRIYRSGEVIPVIEKVIKPAEVGLPTNCPVCGHELEDTGTDLICNNPKCDNIQRSRLNSWLSKIGKVDGLGGKTKRKVISYFEINKIQDIYKEDYRERLEELKKVDGFGSSTIRKVKEMFDKFYGEIKFSRLLNGLGLPLMGGKTCRKISLECDRDALLDGTESQVYVEIKSVKGLSGKVADEWINNQDLIKEVVQLTSVEFEDKDELPDIDIQIAVTGAMSIKRSEFKELMRKHGVEVKGLSNSTDYLVTNKSSSSSKYKKAQRKGIPIISEEDIRDMVGAYE